MREDHGGEFWNVVIGAAVGGLINAGTTAIKTYKENGAIDWGQVAISGVVGAISGGVAATGLGAIAQASITAGASAIGSVATDFYSMKKSTGKIKPTLKETGQILGRAVGSAAIGFGSSVFGSAAGEIVSRGMRARGANMVLRGSTGAECFTKAQARNLMKQGTTMINTARGISSVVGTVFTWPGATAFSSLLS